MEEKAEFILKIWENMDVDSQFLVQCKYYVLRENGKMCESEVAIPAMMDRVFQQVRDPLFLVDYAGRCCYGNQAVLDFLGYTSAEFETLKVWQVSETHHEKDWKTHWDRIRNIGSGEMLSTHRKSNGEKVDVIVSATYLQDQKNQWLYIRTREKSEMKSMLGCTGSAIDPNYNIFRHLEEGVALHEIILDEAGHPADYRFLEINRAFCALLGFEREDVLGKTVKELLPKTPNSLIQRYGEVALGRKTMTFQHYSKDLKKHWKVYAYSPAAMQFITIFTDVSDMINKQLELELERERLQMAVDAADLAFLDIQMDQGLVHVQGGIFQAEQTTSLEVLDRLFDDIHPADRKIIADYRARLEEGKLRNFSIELRLRRDHKERWIEMNLKVMEVMTNGRAKRIIGVIRDIDEKKRERQRFEFLASHDILTGTYNRNAFERYIRGTLPEERYPVGMLLFDVDGLKLLNDGFGHGEGDLLLTYFAETLKKEFQAPARIFRIGGDEFAAVVPNVKSDEIAGIQERIKEQVEAFELPIQASISSGFGVIGSKDEHLEDVFRDAEDRMYRNKLWEKRKERRSMSETLIKSLQSRTHEDYSHFTRIEELAMKMAEVLELDDHARMVLRKLAYAHDIGKLATPHEILYKPDNLSEEEWTVMRKHSEVGYRIALGLNDLALAASDILLHHEHWDGTGYPHGLKGTDIPLTARIIAILDAYDAMTHERCYRERLSHREAVEELKNCAGTQFDPELVEIFTNLL